ncbi:protein of unknown function [Burkholderia multivorans]
MPAFDRSRRIAGDLRRERQGLGEFHHGWIKYLALADRAADRRAGVRHEEAAQYRQRPRQRREGLQGRHARRRCAALRRAATAALWLGRRQREGNVAFRFEQGVTPAR